MSTDVFATPGSAQMDTLTTAGGAPQPRSRITVVCAECKRLKLKCDRKAPCGSCVKRETVPRCIYSAAAADKVDLHSLNNRLCAVEATLANHSSPGKTVIATGAGPALLLTQEVAATLWPDDLNDTEPILNLINKDSYALPQQNAQNSLLILPQYAAWYSACGPMIPPGVISTLPSSSHRAVLFGHLSEATKNHLHMSPREIQALVERTATSSTFSSRADARTFMLGEPRRSDSEASVADLALSSALMAFGLLLAGQPDGLPSTPQTLSHDKQTDSPESKSSEDCMLLDGGNTRGRRPSNGVKQRKTTNNTAAKANGNEGASYGVPYLLALSRQALVVVRDAEKPRKKDTSRAEAVKLVETLIVHVVCAWYQGDVEAALALIGETVGMARAIGLHRELELYDIGDEIREKEREQRKRVWWSVVWTDAFTAAITDTVPLVPVTDLGLPPPTICSPHVRPYAEMDDQHDLAFFAARIRLVHLARTLAPVPQSMAGVEDAANRAIDIDNLLIDLGCSNESTDDHPALAELDWNQRALITIYARSLEAGVYLPFIRGSDKAAGQLAMSGAADAAHRLIRALEPYFNTGPSDMVHRVCVIQVRFAAGSLAAYTARKSKGAVWSEVAFSDAHKALDGLPSPADAIMRRAESAGQKIGLGIGSGEKRKRVDSFAGGDCIPSQPFIAFIPPTNPTSSRSSYSRHSKKDKEREREREREKEKDKDKRPTIGIRVRLDGPESKRERRHSSDMNPPSSPTLPSYDREEDSGAHRRAYTTPAPTSAAHEGSFTFQQPLTTSNSAPGETLNLGPGLSVEIPQPVPPPPSIDNPFPYNDGYHQRPTIDTAYPAPEGHEVTHTPATPFDAPSHMGYDASRSQPQTAHPGFEPLSRPQTSYGPSDRRPGFGAQGAVGNYDTQSPHYASGSSRSTHSPFDGYQPHSASTYTSNGEAGHLYYDHPHGSGTPYDVKPSANYAGQDRRGYERPQENMSIPMDAEHGYGQAQPAFDHPSNSWQSGYYPNAGFQ